MALISCCKQRREMQRWPFKHSFIQLPVIVESLKSRNIPPFKEGYRRAPAPYHADEQAHSAPGATAARIRPPRWCVVISRRARRYAPLAHVIDIQEGPLA